MWVQKYLGIMTEDILTSSVGHRKAETRGKGPQMVQQRPKDRPFKNPYYNKNVNRRAKNLKTVLGQEREKDRLKREALRKSKAEKAAMGMMDVDGDDEEEEPNYSSIEAPPSVWPPRHYCDITGLEAPYTDPATGLRYHDKSVYEIIQGLVAASEASPPEGEKSRELEATNIELESCLEGVVLDVESTLDTEIGRSDLALVIFGIPDVNEGHRTPLVKESKSRWIAESVVSLPETIPDLTIVLSSENVGDVGFVSFTGTELTQAKSFDITNSIAVSRNVAVDGLGDATRVSLSFAVWPRVVKAEMIHHGLSSLFKIMPPKKVPVEGRELYSAELKPAMMMGDTETIVQPATPLDSALGDTLTIGLILKASKLEAELVHGAENSEISRLDDRITSQITQNQDLARDILLSTTLTVLASTVTTGPHEPSRPFVLCRVGKAFVTIWKRTRPLQHLNQAVDNLQEGVATLSIEPRAWMLSSLSSTLIIRYKLLNNRADLYGAISILQKELKIKETARDAAKLLCLLFQHLFKISTDLSWLVEAVKTAQLGLKSGTADPRSLFDALEGVSRAISKLSPHLNTDKSKLLQDAITLQTSAIGMLQPSDTNLVDSYFNLGTIYETLFKQSCQLQDIRDAIVSFQKALEHCTPDRAIYPSIFGAIGEAFRLQWTVTDKMSDLEEAIRHGTGFLTMYFKPKYIKNT
ncbi:hypothetical protein H1R20_g15793, partial [Candolleomyces eurysporus]